MQKIDVVRALAAQCNPDDLFIHSIGCIQDDWWNYRPGGVDNTFSPHMLGSISSTALGLALALPHRRVVSLETDGSVLMNAGIMCTIGAERPPNLTIVVFDNGCYESIGCPLTLTSINTDLAKMAEGAGCINCATARDVETFSAEARRLLTDSEMGFLVAKVEIGTYPWPEDKKKDTDGVEDKYRFMRYVEKLEGIRVHRIHN
ncbi:MAG: thiamine pyrophosphate-binding protein [Chloroflexi bacterium]|nr:thiamine pyrophosphate-binding protein [Chloroflexota bacterium]